MVDKELKDLDQAVCHFFGVDRRHPEVELCKQ